MSMTELCSATTTTTSASALCSWWASFLVGIAVVCRERRCCVDQSIISKSCKLPSSM